MDQQDKGSAEGTGILGAIASVSAPRNATPPLFSPAEAWAAFAFLAFLAFAFVGLEWWAASPRAIDRALSGVPHPLLAPGRPHHDSRELTLMDGVP